MTNASKSAGKIFYYSKYLGLALIAIGIPIVFMDNSRGAEMPLLTGLFTLLIASEKIQDERSIQIKITSLYIAFMIAYATTLLSTNLYQHALIPFALKEINHFLILTLALANGIFYGRLYILKH